MTKFSDQLVNKTIMYFAEEYNHHIDQETANQYLSSFARLFLAFAEKGEEKMK